MQRRTARSDRLFAPILAAVVLTLASCRGGDVPVSSAKDTGIAEQTDKTDAAITAGEPSSAETDGEDRTGVADTDGQTPVSAGETSEDTQTTGVQTTGAPGTEPVKKKEKIKHPDDDNVDWDAWQT